MESVKKKQFSYKETNLKALLYSKILYQTFRAYDTTFFRAIFTFVTGERKLPPFSK